MDICLAHLSFTELAISRRLFNTAYYASKNLLANAQFEGLLTLQELNGVNVGTHYRNINRCEEFKSVCAEILRDKLKEELAKAEEISAMIDGTTDRVTKAKETVRARFVGDDYSVKSVFIGFIENADATADSELIVSHFIIVILFFIIVIITTNSS